MLTARLKLEPKLTEPPCATVEGTTEKAAATTA
jgi:hypothetical protein